VNIGFAGLGKLGLPVALAIEAKGHTVVGYDPAEGPRETLRTRRLTYREAGAETLLQETRIEILPVEEVVRRSDLIFVTIQTPHEPRWWASPRSWDGIGARLRIAPALPASEPIRGSVDRRRYSGFGSPVGGSPGRSPPGGPKRRSSSVETIRCTIS